jgi:hypothetical protein
MCANQIKEMSVLQIFQLCIIDYMNTLGYGRSVVYYMFLPLLLSFWLFKYPNSENTDSCAI